MNPIIYKNEYSREIKNLCILCIYLHTEKIPLYTFHYIRQIKKCGYETFVISHSAFSNDDVDVLRNICCGIVVKDNFGYDFFAWKKGLEFCDNGDHLDNLLLANDSIIGPFKNITHVFTEMNERFDFWGLTENFEHHYHIQSYFLHANRKVIHSNNWINFWNDLKLYENKIDIVKNYEVELSRLLSKDNNIKIGSWITTEQIRQKTERIVNSGYPNTAFWYGNANPTIRYWKDLILFFDFPFIKKNLFFDKEHYHVVYNGRLFVYNVYPVNWKNIIRKRYGDAAISLIEEHVTKFYREKANYEHVVLEKYKVIIVCQTLKENELDYLCRILKFYSANKVGTELIVNDAKENIPGYNRYKLQNLTKAVFLKSLTENQKEEHKYLLNMEKVGTIIVKDADSVALAQNYLYTGAPILLLAETFSSERSIDDYILLSEKMNAKFITPLKSVKTAFAEKNIDASLLDPILDDNSFQKLDPLFQANEDVFKIGLIGITTPLLHCDHVYFVVESILKQSDHNECFLFLSEAEMQIFNQHLKAKDQLDKLRSNERLKIVKYTDELDHYLNQHNIDLLISYFKTNSFPDAFLSAYKNAIPIIGLFNSGIQFEIFSEEPGLFYCNYFDTGELLERIKLLKTDKNRYSLMSRKTSEAFRNYFNEIKESNAEKILFKETIDFTELQKPLPRITVIFHFHFYSFDAVSFEYYRQRLRQFQRNNINFIFSITEDSYNIEEHAALLKESFPGCTIKVVPNKGRDIGAKFLLFDHYFRQAEESEYVVVLHDKKSLHLPYGEALAWIESLLKIIDPTYLSSILAKFESDKNIGIIGSSERIVDCIVKWEEYGTYRKPFFEWNNDLLHEMISKYSISISDYNFVGGTMFWIRNDVLKMIHTKYDFLCKFQELEEGNVMDNHGSTITHCWERLLCWISTNLGFKVAGI